MSINNDKENETQIDSEFSKLNSVTINHKNCNPWCKKYVAHLPFAWYLNPLPFRPSKILPSAEGYQNGYCYNHPGRNSQ